MNYIQVFARDHKDAAVRALDKVQARLECIPAERQQLEHEYVAEMRTADHAKVALEALRISEEQGLSFASDNREKRLAVDSVYQEATRRQRDLEARILELNREQERLERDIDILQRFLTELSSPGS